MRAWTKIHVKYIIKTTNLHKFDFSLEIWYNYCIVHTVAILANASCLAQANTFELNKKIYTKEKGGI